MSINDACIMKTLDDKIISEVLNFVYLGSEVQSSEKDMTIRIAKAWAALNKLTSIWKSNLPDNLKRSFFRAVV